MVTYFQVSPIVPLENLPDFTMIVNKTSVVLADATPVEVADLKIPNLTVGVYTFDAVILVSYGSNDGVQIGFELVEADGLVNANNCFDIHVRNPVGITLDTYRGNFYDNAGMVTTAIPTDAIGGILLLIARGILAIDDVGANPSVNMKCYAAKNADLGDDAEIAKGSWIRIERISKVAL